MATDHFAASGLDMASLYDEGIFGLVETWPMRTRSCWTGLGIREYRQGGGRAGLGSGPCVSDWSHPNSKR